MCIAVPGKVISKDNGMGLVDFKGNQIEVDLRLVDAGVGDYVLVHAGCAIEVVLPEEAEELSELLAEVEELGRGEA